MKALVIFAAVILAPPSDDPGIPDDAVPVLQVCNPIMPPSFSGPAEPKSDDA